MGRFASSLVKPERQACARGLLLCIDPATDPKRFGWSVLWGGWIQDVGTGWPTEGPYDALVIEKPQVYRQSKQDGDPNDLIDVAVMVGQMIERYARNVPSFVYQPSQWKGQTPKLEHNQRVMADVHENDKIQALFKIPASYRHNVVDAIGMGIWFTRKEGIRR